MFIKTAKVKKIQIRISYTQYKNIEELSPLDMQLIKASQTARETSYSPYSNFKVGAACLMEDSRVYKGANFENAAYPTCLCAERVALSTCFAQQPNGIIQKIAITIRNPQKVISIPGAPCGSCRQVLSEVENRQGKPIEVLLYGENGPVWVFETAKDLLPLSFDDTFL